MLPYDKRLKALSQSLRRNMTDAERRLWARLKNKQVDGYPFYRQKIIGSFIVDFYCPKARLVIELDGGHHYSENGKMKDRVRDLALGGLGLCVLRFSDRDVFENIAGVMETIYGVVNVVKKSPLTPLC